MVKRFLGHLLLLALGLIALPDWAEAQYFGRNKVQYRSFDFRVIETDNFDIYYYDEEKEAALDAARMAERAYARLSRILQHEFRSRKPIILYASHSEFQQTNALADYIDEGTGGVTESLKERVIMPFTGSYAEFDHVLRHELVHSFQFDVIFRNAAMDNVNPFAHRYPLWFMEGMAEYLSIGHIDAITAAWLRDAVLSGYLRTIDEMNMRDDYLSYRFGQALWAYIGSKWGDEVIGILLQKATRVGVQRAFESTLGMSLAALSQEWTAAVRRTYLPQIAEYERPESFARPLLRHAKLEDPSYMSPAISPDGKWLAVFSQRDGFFPDLWLVDAETGEFERRLIRSNVEADFESLRYQSSSAAFSPDGKHLAFAAQSGGRDVLYIYDLDRKRIVKQIKVDLSAIMSPTWSPDGKQIAFSGMDGGLSDLFVTDLDGNVTRLTNDRHADLFPAWSPDGQKIAFSTDRSAETDFDRLSYGELKVALYDLESGDIELLPHQEEGRSVNPVWSPDSRYLIWVSDMTGTKDLYLYDRDEDSLARITNVLSGMMGPTATDLSPVLSWARESGRLVFAYFEAGGHSVYSVDDPLELPRVAISELSIIRQDVPILATGGEQGGGADTARVELPTPADTTGAEPLPGVALGSISFYRQGDSFRPSSQLPDGVEVEKPISVIALLDSAEMALPDTSAFKLRPYEVKFSADMIGRPTIGAEVGGFYGNGLYGGSFISLSDMLGNHNILLAGSISGSFSDASFYTGYNFLKKRANLGSAILQVPMYRYLGSCYYCTGVLPGNKSGDVVAADIFERDLTRAVQGVVSYPFNTYQRLELTGTAAYWMRDRVFRGENLSRQEYLNDSYRITSAKYLLPSAALVFDNALFGWTGPIAGRRYRIEASRTIGDFKYTEGYVDFRNYFNYKRDLVFASRLLAVTRFGQDADRFLNYWGGPYFLRGYDADSYISRGGECDPSMGGAPATGCSARDQLIGSSAAIFTAEVRYPIIKELQIGFLGNFPPVDAIAFFDAGLAWNNKICMSSSASYYGDCSGEEERVHLVWKRKPDQDPLLYREPLYSYGFGLRINVFFTVLRLDYAIPLSRSDRGGRFTVSFGPSF